MGWEEKWNGSVVISFRTFSVWREPDEEDSGLQVGSVRLKGPHRSSRIASSAIEGEFIYSEAECWADWERTDRMESKCPSAGERRNSQRACGSTPADERQQSENVFLCSVLILLDPFFLFRLKDYGIKGNDRSSIPGVHHPQKDAGLILCTQWTDMSVRERCVWWSGDPSWGPSYLSWLAPESKLLNRSACSCFCYRHQLRWQELWDATGGGGKHSSSNTFVWHYLVWMTKTWGLRIRSSKQEICFSFFWRKMFQHWKTGHWKQYSIRFV